MTLKHSLLTSLCIIGLQACTTMPESTVSVPLPQLTYEQLAEIPVNVRKINYVSKQQRGTQAWDIANTVPTPPDVAVRRYLENRFKASGGHGVLNLTLSKAQITKTEVPNENRILSYVPLANIDEYVTEIILDVESLYLSGEPNRMTSLRFVRRTRMPLDVTMAYREAKLQRTVEEITRDIDEVLTRSLVDEFALISAKNRPVYAMDVDTQLPDIETNLGVAAKEFRESVDAAGQKIKQAAEGNKTEVTQDGKPIMLRPVTSDQVNQ